MKNNEIIDEISGFTMPSASKFDVFEFNWTSLNDLVWLHANRADSHRNMFDSIALVQVMSNSNESNRPELH